MFLQKVQLPPFIAVCGACVLDSLCALHGNLSLSETVYVYMDICYSTAVLQCSWYLL